MRFRLHSLVRRVLQLAIALLVLLSLGGLILFTVYSFFPSISIPYLSPAQKITEDTVFYRRSWREPFEYDIKVYASQSDSIPVHNATAFFENAQLLWHVQPQSLEKKYPKHSTKVNVKIPPSVFHESIWSRSNIYVHVFIQRSDQFMPHPNVTDPYLVHTSKEVLNKPDIYYDGTWENSELNNTSSTTVHKYRVPYWSLLSWDLVLEDHMHTSETLPKAFRPWINDSPNDESNPGTYNPPLIYRKTEGYRNMATYILEMMPKSTGSSNRTSLPASTERTASIDVELKIQGIAQGWVRGEEAIVKLAERKYERKTKTITESPRYHRSESSVAYGGVHSDQFGSATPTAAVSSDNIGGAHLSNSDMSELEGHESETLASAPENVREVVYVDYINGFLPEYILSYASVLNVILYVFSVPLAVALLLTELGDTVAFWSRENTKWEGTSRLVVVLEVVYQCGHLVLVHTDGWIYYTDTTYFDTRPRSIKVFLMRFYAGLSLWVFAALYNIPLNPFMWRRRIFSLHAPPPSEITKPVLAGNDDGSSTTTRAGKLPRMCSRDLAISTQQEIDQRFNRLLLWLGIPSLVLYPVYITTMSRDYLRDSDPVYVVKNVLYMIRAFQLLPQVVINYRTKSVAWIPITAYMCELLINIHQMLATWVIAWPVFFKLVPAGTSLIHCLLLAVFAVQWARYYKAKQD
ncbi:hypothetical protein GQ54DRAFT_333930 [Martensiomyces pterosporus]|nr:hypothetical protein GQ54DRAFT_333930 [Martensiomyces pterosporus]